MENLNELVIGDVVKISRKGLPIRVKRITHCLHCNEPKGFHGEYIGSRKYIRHKFTTENLGNLVFCGTGIEAHRFAIEFGHRRFNHYHAGYIQEYTDLSIEEAERILDEWVREGLLLYVGDGQAGRTYTRHDNPRYQDENR